MTTWVGACISYEIRPACLPAPGPRALFRRPTYAGHAGFNHSADPRGMRIALAMLTAIAGYFVWATTFASVAATAPHP